MTPALESSKSLRVVTIPVRGADLEAELVVPAHPAALTLLCHGVGASRHHDRSAALARDLQEIAIATLSVDLLTLSEERADSRTHHFRYDIELLGERLVAVVDWARRQRDLSALPLAIIGSGTASGAALAAAADRPEVVKAVISRAGRPDLAGPALRHVVAPVLLIAGGTDYRLIELNTDAIRHLTCVKKLELILEGGHLLDEPTSIDAVAALAGQWIREHVVRS
ncbi:MAG TPA: hydrolase [Thermoanaerobaculia bacterium]|nr:hydrolase [Thermoanaerobaculia bacterium]